MRDLASRLRAFVSGNPAPGGAEEARTKRTNTLEGAVEGDCAHCARDSGEVQTPEQWRPRLPAGAPLERQTEAIFVYEERLAIAADLGLDTAPGSEADAIARREARRVTAGFPSGQSASRAGDLIDTALELFEPLGGLHLIELKPRPQGAARDPSKS